MMEDWAVEAAQKRKAARKDKEKREKAAGRLARDMELAGAKAFLGRFQELEALARRLEALEGSMLRNARVVMDDANAILRGAERVLSEVNTAGERLRLAEGVELEARLRRNKSLARSNKAAAKG